LPAEHDEKRDKKIKRKSICQFNGIFDIEDAQNLRRGTTKKIAEYKCSSVSRCLTRVVVKKAKAIRYALRDDQPKRRGWGRMRTPAPSGSAGLAVLH
jgi:hypothetical protein